MGQEMPQMMAALGGHWDDGLFSGEGAVLCLSGLSLFPFPAPAPLW